MNIPQVPHPRATSIGECAPVSLLKPQARDSLALVLKTPSPPEVVGMGDWIDLLVAVEARLTQAVGQQSSVPHSLELPEGPGRVQAAVLECVGALRQLHLMLQADLVKRQQLELEVFDTHTALAQARADQGAMRTADRFAPDGTT